MWWRQVVRSVWDTVDVGRKVLWWYKLTAKVPLKPHSTRQIHTSHPTPHTLCGAFAAVAKVERLGVGCELLGVWCGVWILGCSVWLMASKKRILVLHLGWTWAGRCCGGTSSLPSSSNVDRLTAS